MVIEMPNILEQTMKLLISQTDDTMEKGICKITG